jgi:AraC-like DNA-binding protein
MAFNPKDVIVEHDLEGLISGRMSGYVPHVYCFEGECCFSINDSLFEIHKNETMIVLSPTLNDVRPSDDFQVKVIYVTGSFLEASTPRSNYGIKGTLALYLNPIMKLTEVEQQRLKADFELVERRLSESDHRFHEDIMMCTLQSMFLDFFDCHARVYGSDEISLQNSQIMQRFFSMLESGTYKEHRDIGYYASELCITSKYLSEICRKITGMSANFWINRFTIMDINRQLKARTKSLVEIADEFNFSSQAYFTRYVQNYLGQIPSNYR